MSSWAPGSLRELFDEQFYANLEGGILESFGRLFKNDLKLYIYPLLDRKTGELTTLVEFTGTEGPHVGSDPYGRLVAEPM